MMPKNTSLNGLQIITSKLKSDKRGSFSRLFCAHELANAIGERKIVQINQSLTMKKGAVRGLHFQKPPHAEMKLVRCLKGCVWDVAVDLRANSPTLFQWHAEKLSAESNNMMVIPEGFAHGFQVLEPDSMLLYLHTAYYAPESEGGLHPNDPKLAIEWPLEITELSERDCAHRFLTTTSTGYTL
jgi:dTDP-4-dehydrorhamnose 3,5-epimerase